MVHRVWILAAGLTLAFSAAGKSRSGREIFNAACAGCHGPDGKGAPDSTVVFEKPKTFPDFTDCNATTPEPNETWRAIIRDGGTGRGFSTIMPSFREALTAEEIDRVVEHLRGFCTNPSWPRGEFNLPLALITEKAFPENEIVITGSVNTHGEAGFSNDIIYEKRFGIRDQLEVDIPIEASRPDAGKWAAGVGDATIGWKHVMCSSLKSGSLFSTFGGVVVPSGNYSRGFGAGTTVLEAFGAYAQLFPHSSFLQTQFGTEQPLNLERASRVLFWRTAVGKSFTQANARMWTPMVELVADHEFGGEPATFWDVVPEMQVTLSRRQHVRLNAGVRIPVGNTQGRHPVILFNVLWDWFDGGIKDGWK